MVKIKPPPPAKATNPIFFTLPTASRLLRIYSPQPYGTQPCSFRSAGGAIGRFDHHSPTDLNRAIHYSAATLEGCLVECFQDGDVVTQDRRLAFLETTRSLLLLDLRRRGAMRAGTVAALCGTEDRSLSQSWARYFYDRYPDIEGLVYSNAHNQATAYALFERSQDALTCIQDRSLDDPALTVRLLAACEANNLVFIR